MLEKDLAMRIDLAQHRGLRQPVPQLVALRQAAVVGGPDQPIDPRLASPEMTWNLLIASLKAGDIDTAMLCLTPNMQSRFRPLFTGMTKEALREMAESFTGFGGASPLGENAYEAYATRGTLAGSIQFQKANGMWRIVEM